MGRRFDPDRAHFKKPTDGMRWADVKLIPRHENWYLGPENWYLGPENRYLGPGTLTTLLYFEYKYVIIKIRTADLSRSSKCGLS